MPKRILTLTAVAVYLVACGISGCQRASNEQSAEVIATAYTLSEAETKKGNVGLAAWDSSKR